MTRMTRRGSSLPWSAGIVVLALLAAPSCAGRRHARPADALEATVLAPAWQQDLDFGGLLELRAAGGSFVVFGSAGQVVAFDGATGRPRWRADLGQPLAAPPVVAEDATAGAWAAVPIEDGIVLLSLGDGRTRAAGVKPPGGILALSSGGGSLIAVTGAGRILAFDPGTGTERWSTQLPSPPAPVPPTSCASQIVTALEDGRIAGLEAGSGSIRWTRSLGSPAASAPGCDERHLYVATAANDLHALRLHRRSAGRMWRARSGADPAAPPVSLGETVLLLSKDTYLYGLKRRNGHLVFRIRLGRRPGPAAILEDLVLVTGLHATRLDAYRLPQGLNAGGFSLPEGTRFVTPPVALGGTVAFGAARFGESDQARIVALALEHAPPGP